MLYRGKIFVGNDCRTYVYIMSLAFYIIAFLILMIYRVLHRLHVLLPDDTTFPGRWNSGDMDKEF